jgi:dihydroxy-acid dehydratase
MFTANTMSTCIEALGMSLPGTSTLPAVDESTNECVIGLGSCHNSNRHLFSRVHPDVVSACRRTARAIKTLMEKNIRSRDILTLRAFENAITVMMALGGSTNGVLHLLAIAREAEVTLGRGGRSCQCFGSKLRF